MTERRTAPSGTVRHIEALWNELENQAVHDPVLRLTLSQIVYAGMDREQALLGAVLHLAKTVKELTNAEVARRQHETNPPVSVATGLFPPAEGAPHE